MKVTWGNASALVFFLISAGVATQVYKIAGDKSNMLFMWLGALGITGYAFYAFLLDKWHSRKQVTDKAAQAVSGVSAAVGGESKSGGGGEGSGAVDELVKEAETKFGASPVSQGKKIEQMPVIFLLGDQGSTKTTVFVNSGLEPELLSGQVHQTDNTIASTRATNIWFAKKAVFVEAGGGLWNSGEGWTRLLKKLSPQKLKSVFGGGGASPRAAVLCMDIERFLQAGASDTMSTVARSVRTRLSEISTQFGISFPVYVLFTKIDRVTFFHDYVRNLDQTEARQVFGVTLPLRRTKGGTYGEEETNRLKDMFNELFYSLCDKRVEFLPRENDPEKLPGCYEFPREFRKLCNNLVQFLVDVGQPSQISTSPFLRGFYFTGVRPVIVQDVASTPIVSKQSAFGGAGNATTMFKLPDFGKPEVPMAAPQQSGGRKMPQWVFLSHLFNNVILEDKAALGASEASTKTSGLQRILLGTLAVLAFLWTIGMTVSFFRNRGLESDISEAAQQLKNVRLAPNALPSEDDLRRLKGLREKLELLTKWKKEGAPWSYRWGLYVGNSLYEPTRKAYYNGFQELLFRDTQISRMLTTMQGLPAQARPEDDYNRAYETLRAYLITTSQWQRVAPPAEQSRLKTTLASRWSEKRETAIGDGKMKQADDEFQFYSSDLINGNPYSPTENAQGVHQTRLHLASFSGFEQYYNRLVNEASAAKPAVNYNRMYPWTSAVVTNNRDVPGAFTKAGWDWMRNRLANPDNLGGEEWVLGPPDKYPRANVNPRTLVQEIWKRYSDDFVGRWRDYFKKNTAVGGYSSTQDAANKLKTHSSSQAPILYLIGLATQNTSVEPASDPYAKRVRDAFLWAHTVVPAPGTQMIVGKNEPYVNALGALQAVVADFAATPGDTSKIAPVGGKKTEALATTGMVSRAPNADLEAGLDQTIRNIMEKPINVDISMAGPVNAAAGKFCQQFNIIKDKFPFNPAKKEEVSVIELNSMLSPGTGAFWQFYEQSLKQFLQKQGAQYVPVAGSPITFNQPFITFFNQVAGLAEAMYRGGPGNPRLSYQVQLASIELILDKRPASAGSLTIDGKAASLGGPLVGFTWTGAPTHSVQFRNEGQTAFDESSLWAVFRFFVDTQVSGAGGNYTMIYTQRGGNQNREFAKARFQVDLSGAPAVFDKSFLNGLRCIANAAK